MAGNSLESGKSVAPAHLQLPPETVMVRTDDYESNIGLRYRGKSNEFSYAREIYDPKVHTSFLYKDVFMRSDTGLYRLYSCKPNILEGVNLRPVGTYKRYSIPTEGLQDMVITIGEPNTICGIPVGIVYEAVGRPDSRFEMDLRHPPMRLFAEKLTHDPLVSDFFTTRYTISERMYGQRKLT